MTAPRCNHHAPSPDGAVNCNRQVNHEGPHRGVVNPDEIIFWSWGKPRRVLIRLRRDGELWIIVDPTE